MKEYPIEMAYQHDTFLYKKQDNLKIGVTIYAPTNVYFILKRDGNTFSYYAKIGKTSIDTKIFKRHMPEIEFDWDNNGKTISTKVFDLDGVEISSNSIHTDNAIQY